MRKFLSILILALFMGQSINAQNKMPDNKRQWFVFNNPQYRPTKSDIVEIAKGMPAMKTGKYKLKNGQIFWCYHPERWVVLMKRILTKVKGSEVTNIANELATGTIVPWDDNISTKTKNYGVEDNGEEVVVDGNYSGGDGIDCLVYMGYPVLKTFKPCINPEDPEIAAAPIPIVPETPKVEEKKKEVKEKEEEKEIEVKEKECCPTGLSVDDVVKLWKAFSEAQPKAEPTYMVLGNQQSNDPYNWRAQQRDYYEPQRYGFRELLSNFFLSININGNQRQQYEQAIYRTMSQGIGAGNSSGNGGVGGVFRRMSSGVN
mgnify:FL=1